MGGTQNGDKGGQGSALTGTEHRVNTPTLLPIGRIPCVFP